MRVWGLGLVPHCLEDGVGLECEYVMVRRVLGLVLDTGGMVLGFDGGLGYGLGTYALGDVGVRGGTPLCAVDVAYLRNPTQPHPPFIESSKRI